MKKILSFKLLIAVALMIFAVSCEETNKPEKIAVQKVTVSRTTKTLIVGEDFTIKATVEPSNATNKEVKWQSDDSDVASVDTNGKVKAIKAGTATITVTTVDGNKTATCRVTVEEKGSDITLLTNKSVIIEDFTADWCGPCYQGMKNIQKVLKDFDDRVLLVYHHINDNFGISESAILANAYKVTGIPAFMVNRTPGIGEAGILFHPGYLTKAMIDKQLAMENSVLISLKTTYSDSSKELKVNVSGKLLKDFPNARLNVYLVQDSIVAKQAGGGNNYAHRNALRKVLSQDGVWGDQLGITVGRFSKTYTYTIPDKIGKLATELNKMYVVAFVAEHHSTTEMKNNIVHNAIIKKIK